MMVYSVTKLLKMHSLDILEQVFSDKDLRNGLSELLMKMQRSCPTLSRLTEAFREIVWVP